VNRQTAVGLLIAALLAYSIFCPTGPKRPFLHWLGQMALNGLKVAPVFFFQEKPEEASENRVMAIYNASEIRSIDEDGLEIVDHGEGF
jgi:hypothetical protein